MQEQDKEVTAMLDSIDLAKTEDLQSRNAELRKLNKELERNLGKTQAKLGAQKEYVDQVCGAVTALPPYPQFLYTHAQQPKNPIIPNLDISDLHTGELIQSSQVEGLNKYNWRIEQEGLFGIVEDFLKWVEIHRKWFTIEQCNITLKGDYISGDIHQELQTTNEFPLPVQTAKAGTLLGEVFRMICGHFKLVTVIECGADNHGRLQHKPQAKQKAANSMSFLVHHIANAAASKCNNFRPIMSDGMMIRHTINGKSFLVTHGDTIKSVMGFPWYSLGRMIGREALRRMGHPKLTFDYFSIGHFHTPMFIENKTIVNGSLSGTSEFDHSCGRYAIPCQVAFMVHPKHGVFNFSPFVRGDVKHKRLF
jgi:hypothetical protein